MILNVFILLKSIKLYSYDICPFLYIHFNKDYFKSYSFLVKKCRHPGIKVSLFYWWTIYKKPIANFIYNGETLPISSLKKWKLRQKWPLSSPPFNLVLKVSANTIKDGGGKKVCILERKSCKLPLITGWLSTIKFKIIN